MVAGGCIRSDKSGLRQIRLMSPRATPGISGTAEAVLAYKNLADVRYGSKPEVAVGSGHFRLGPDIAQGAPQVRFVPEGDPCTAAI